MSLINLRIERIIIHQIYQRDKDGNKVSPNNSAELINFDDNAMQTFKKRFISAVGENSKAVEMTIIEQDNDKLPAKLDSLKSKSSDDDFIRMSIDISNKLADAQNKKNIPGGIVAIFDGLYGATPKRFVGIIKAEIHSAYEKTVDKITQEIGLKYVEEALLTPATKLYKTACFLNKGNDSNDEDLNSRWNVLVSDTQISQNGGTASAFYFYNTFLGCGYPKTSARTTQKFYIETSKFINDMDISEEKRSDIHTALNVYLKQEKTDVINPTEFASRHFDIETCDSYSVYLKDKELPLTSFTKDIQYVAPKLKTRKLAFSQNIKIIVPADKFSDLIEMEEVYESDGKKVNWTKIIIKDRIVSQE